LGCAALGAALWGKHGWRAQFAKSVALYRAQHLGERVGAGPLVGTAASKYNRLARSGVTPGRCPLQLLGLQGLGCRPNA
jgi:hypothetical protein